MAKQVVTILTDDLTGGEADRSVEFGLDGVNYSIDLSEANIGKLRKALDPYISAGSRQGRNPGVGQRGPRRGGVESAPVTRDQNRAIREWARKDGRKLAERGRIPSEVVEAYHAR